MASTVCVGLGQGLGYAVQLADERDAAGQDVVGGRADAFQCGQHPVEQGHEHRHDHQQQEQVADPPQHHQSASSGRW